MVLDQNWVQFKGTKYIDCSEINQMNLTVSKIARYEGERQPRLQQDSKMSELQIRTKYQARMLESRQILREYSMLQKKA